MDSSKWIPVEERVPENYKFVLLSFANFLMPMIGYYFHDPADDSGAFYLGEELTASMCNLFVNAWMPLPKCYEEE